MNEKRFALGIGENRVVSYCDVVQYVDEINSIVLLIHNIKGAVPCTNSVDVDSPAGLWEFERLVNLVTGNQIQKPGVTV